MGEMEKRGYLLIDCHGDRYKLSHAIAKNSSPITCHCTLFGTVHVPQYVTSLRIIFTET